MSKLKESIGLGLLFAAGTAGVYAFDEVRENRERDSILECYVVADDDELNGCINRVDSEEYSLSSILEAAGALGTIACGIVAYRAVRDSEK